MAVIPPTGNFHIDTYTVGEISQRLEFLDRYKDPFGYLAECTPDWVTILKENPAAQPSDLAIIFAVDGDVLVGRLGIFAAFVSIGDSKTRTFSLALFELHTAYRKTGAGAIMLLRVASASNSLVASGGIPPEVQRLYSAAGFRELARFRRYVYFYQTRILFEAFCNNPRLCVVLSLIAGPALHLYYKLRSFRSKRGLEFQPVEKFGDNVERLLARRTGNYFPRDADTLNWVLRSRPNVRGFEVFRGGQCIGYSLVRVTNEPAQSFPRRLPAMRLGSLLDYYIEGCTRSEKRSLLDFCRSRYNSKDADAFKCQAHDDEMAAICSSRGMIRVGGNRVFFRPPRGVSISADDRWFLTQAEGDVILGPT